jgi:hypothetical protein
MLFMRVLFRIVLTTIFIFLAVSKVSALVPQLGTLYIHTQGDRSYISSEIINSGGAPVILCQYSIDGGYSWRTAFLETYYGTTYCKANASNIGTINPQMIIMKAVNSDDQTGASNPPAVFSSNTIKLVTFVAEPSYLDSTTNVRYVPGSLSIRSQINDIWSGLKTCIINNNDVSIGDLQVTKLNNGSYACTKDLQITNPSQLNLLTLNVVDNISYEFSSSPISLMLDSNIPTSNITAVTLNGSVISINASASDQSSGVKKIALWYRLQGVTEWRQVAEQNATVQSGMVGPKNWQTTFSIDKNSIGGNGVFDFFVIAADVVGNSQAPKYVVEKSLSISSPAVAPSTTVTPIPSVTGIIEELDISITPTNSESLITNTPSEANIKEEFLADWISYQVDEGLTFYLDAASDNVIYTKEGVTGFKFYGRAPAGVEVRISVFSDRYDLSTVADADGNWEVAMDQPLEEGDHTAYLYYLNSEQDYYRLEKEMILNVDLNNRSVFSDLNILPESGVEDTTKGIVSFLLMIFGVVMIVIAVAGLNYRRMFRTDEVIEVLPRARVDDNSSIVVIGQKGPYL